ncbi:HpcH/HpaI aldolase/citrate lyase family protein [Achromobacter sp. NPDC008082]|uniref:HpcH/HpaI aldolase/citrate lyase family protein n=1 Tax=Achromobacter sp. NPDC008082 TaxID=3363888 RepID=UPI0036E539A7
MNPLARSLLFVPGDRPDRYARAVASGAHAVILDLEDAVAPAAKAQARAEVVAWLAQGGQGIVRINAADTEWYHEDVQALQGLEGGEGLPGSEGQGLHGRPGQQGPGRQVPGQQGQAQQGQAQQGAPGAGVMLPKADAATVAQTVQALPGRPIITLLETVRGYMDLHKMARLPGVARIAFGSVDFAVDSGIADEGDAMTAIRTEIVLACRHAGLAAPIDGVSLEFNDPEQMQADARRARQLGFGGKLCIHPRQVAAVNAAFQPTPSEQDWARRVLAAFDASHGAATALDGKMIDKPVVERARRIAAESRGAAMA